MSMDGAKMPGEEPADEGDRRFREEVERAVSEADSPDAVWHAQEEVESDWAERRRRLEQASERPPLRA